MEQNGHSIFITCIKSWPLKKWVEKIFAILKFSAQMKYIITELLLEENKESYFHQGDYKAYFF